MVTADRKNKMGTNIFLISLTVRAQHYHFESNLIRYNAGPLEGLKILGTRGRERVMNVVGLILLIEIGLINQPKSGRVGWGEGQSPGDGPLMRY